MLGFLKRFFGKTDAKPKRVVIAVNEFEDEISRRIEEVSKNLTKDALNFRKEFLKLLDSLRCALEKLESAEVKQTVDEKTKAIVLSHRENYLKHLNRVVERLSRVEISDEVENFAEQVFLVDEIISEFYRNSAKSREFAKHLFFDEIERIDKIVESLAKMIDARKKKVDAYGILLAKELRRKGELIGNLLVRKKEIENEVVTIKNRIIEIGKERECLEKELKNLKNDPKFEEYVVLQREENHIDSMEEGLRSRILEMFSPIQRPLRKFSRIVDGKKDVELIKGYLDDSVEALLNDKELRILKLLTELKRCISIDQIDLKDRKKEIILNQIEKISGCFLKEVLDEYEELRKKKALVKKKLYNNQVMLKKKEIQYKLEFLDSKMKEEKEKLFQAERRKEKIEEELLSLKREVEQDLKSFLKREVTISL